jgi:hypothetical protein
LGREFKRLGYKVHLADSVTSRAAKLSRFVDKVHSYPSPAQEFCAFGTAMAALMDTLQPELVVPTCEEVFHLARLDPSHPTQAILFAPPLWVLGQLHHKAEFVELCASLKISVPQTHQLKSLANLAPFSDISKDWVFKPCYSRFGTNTLVSPTQQELGCIDPSPARPWIAQKRILGEEICFYAVARSGQLTAFAAYHASWRLPTGASIAFEGLDGSALNQARQYAEKLAAVCNINGQFACDGIVDREGKLWLIECNPRATSGVHMLSGAGDLARAFLSSNAQSPVLPTHPQKGRQLLPAMATLGFAQAMKMGQVSKWWAAMSACRDVAGIKGDRLPMLGAIIDGLSFMQIGARHGVSATAATTLDIEWNGGNVHEPAA